MHLMLLPTSFLHSRRALFVDILEEAREMAMEQHHGRTLMYTVIGTDWRPFGHPRIRRPIASVVLDKTIREERTDHPYMTSTS